MNQPTSEKSRTLLKILAGLVCVSFALPIVFKQILDVDIWWHLMLGRSAVSHFGLPDLTGFYFTKIIENPSVYRYSLLGDILFYLVHLVGGDIGLQLFSVALIAVSGWLLFGMTRLKGGPLVLAILFFVSATYQLQILRNALFSMPMLCLLLRAWWEARWHQKVRAWWTIAPLLTLWSFLHGSYLLGYGLFGLIFFGDILDHLSKGDVTHLPFRHYLTQLILAAFGIALFNPLTFQIASQILDTGLGILILVAGILSLAAIFWWLRRGNHLTPALQKKAHPYLIGAMWIFIAAGAGLHFQKFFGRDLTMTGIDLASPGGITTIDSPGFWGRLKFGLNNLFWKTASAEFFSSDFLSPFDSLPEIYVWSTLALGVFALFVFFYFRFKSFAYLLPFAATMVLALGYKRMLGYWAILAFFCMFRAFQNQPKPIPHAGKAAWAAAGALWIYFWGGFGLGFWDPGLRNFHTAGFGRGPMFSSAACQDALEHHREEKTFTTVANGGFVLSRWFPKKQIFIDGFFAPHRGGQLRIYQSILFSGEPDAIASQLGIKTAIINLYDIKWFNMFNRAESWYPEAVDEGMVVFVYQPYFQNEVPPLRVHCDLNRLAQLPEDYARMVANRFYQLKTGYLLKGRIEAAIDFGKAQEDLFRDLPAHADDRVREECARNLTMAREKYGEEDSRWLRDEFLYQDALQRGSIDDAKRYGSKIFEAYPNRFEIAMVLVGAAINSGELSLTKRYLLALDRSQTEDPAFFERRKSQIAESYYRAARLMRDHQQFDNGYQFLVRASKLAPARFNDDVLFNEILTYYEGLLERDDPSGAYQMLVKLELRFPENPFVAHLLSATVRDHYEALSLPLTTALNYAEKAIKMGENQNGVPLDAFRENMAQVLEKLGKEEEAAKVRALNNQ